jgi:hypothetical protein
VVCKVSGDTHWKRLNPRVEPLTPLPITSASTVSVSPFADDNGLFGVCAHVD